MTPREANVAPMDVASGAAEIGTSLLTQTAVQSTETSSVMDSLRRSIDRSVELQQKLNSSELQFISTRQRIKIL